MSTKPTPLPFVKYLAFVMMFADPLREVSFVKFNDAYDPVNEILWMQFDELLFTDAKVKSMHKPPTPRERVSLVNAILNALYHPAELL